jgi:hypothetical protein
MIIEMTLKEGGDWWRVDVNNIDTLREILNTGYWKQQKIYAVMMWYEGAYMIYDFCLRQWR